MIEDEYDEWEQKKRDLMYYLAKGEERAARRRIDELVEHTFVHWSDIRACQDKPVYPEKTGQVVQTEKL